MSMVPLNCSSLSIAQFQSLMFFNLFISRLHRDVASMYKHCFLQFLKVACTLFRSDFIPMTCPVRSSAVADYAYSWQHLRDYDGIPL